MGKKNHILKPMKLKIKKTHMDANHDMLAKNFMTK
jgi:hypothetical protein